MLWRRTNFGGVQIVVWNKCTDLSQVGSGDFNWGSPRKPPTWLMLAAKPLIAKTKLQLTNIRPVSSKLSSAKSHNFASSNPHPPHSRACDRYNKFLRILETSTPNSHRPFWTFGKTRLAGYWPDTRQDPPAKGTQRDTRQDPLASRSGGILGGIHWREALAGFWVGAWCRSIANADSSIKPNNPFLSGGEQSLRVQPNSNQEPGGATPGGCLHPL